MADPRDFTKLRLRIASTRAPYPKYIKGFAQGCFGAWHGLGEAPYHEAIFIAMGHFWPPPLFTVQYVKRERYEDYGSPFDKMIEVSTLATIPGPRKDSLMLPVFMLEVKDPVHYYQNLNRTKAGFQLRRRLHDYYIRFHQTGSSGLRSAIEKFDGIYGAVAYGFDNLAPFRLGIQNQIVQPSLTLATEGASDPLPQSQFGPGLLDMEGYKLMCAIVSDAVRNLETNIFKMLGKEVLLYSSLHHGQTETHIWYGPYSLSVPRVPLFKGNAPDGLPFGSPEHLPTFTTSDTTGEGQGIGVIDMGKPFDAFIPHAPLRIRREAEKMRDVGYSILQPRKKGPRNLVRRSRNNET